MLAYREYGLLEAMAESEWTLEAPTPSGHPLPHIFFIVSILLKGWLSLGAMIVGTARCLSSKPHSQEGVILFWSGICGWGRLPAFKEQWL